MSGPKVVLFAGGVGGSRFALGLRALTRDRWPDGDGGTTAHLTIVANTGDDMWLAGLRITPDLDSLMYALAGVADDERGWGRKGETERVSAELTAYGVGWPWFTLGDLDLGTHIARSAWLRDGAPLSEAVRRLSERWPLAATLLPATDAEVETHVLVESDAPGTPESLHFEEWWVRYRGGRRALSFVQQGAEDARPAPGVAEAVAAADVILLAPSNPVVSIGTMLGFEGPVGGVPGIPGLRASVRTASAPVIGVSPVIGGAVVRGMADACLAATGVRTDAHAIATAYGARANGGLLDGWVVDEVDAAADAVVGIRTVARPLWMTDVAASAAIAGAALELADEYR
ncbi:MAG TPA: 2-phospho-L-lactate transferase [Pseudolysinimonas sp.]|nr:2-phospho-L-lactate transferase [Pseudolysinimonas sp.]